MKKKIKIIFLIFICIVVITFLIFRINNRKNKKNFSIVFEKSLINNYLKPYLDSGFYSVSIRCFEDNIIQGDIHDTSSNGNLFTTKFLFKYDVINDSFNIYEYNDNKRLLHYYISDKKIYATTVEDISVQDEYFNWKIISYTSDFKDKTILAEGKVLSPFDVPNFYYNINNNNIFTATINDNIDNNIRIQKFNFYSVSNDSIEKLIEYNGIYSNNRGEISCGMFDIHIDNNELVYCITDYLTYQIIYSLNILDGSIEELYKNDIENDWIINTYRKDNNNLFIGKYNVENREKGKLEYLNLKSHTAKQFNSGIYYARNKFIMNSMFFHKSEKWEYYDTVENKLKKAKIVNYKSKYFFPVYINVNNNTIMVISEANELFLGKILNY